MPLKPDAAARKDATTVSGTPVRLEHRHFAFIADVIRNMPPGNPKANVAHEFAKACAGSNPRFDRARFLSACGVQS